ncbi:MAG: choice-of-anchor D domain-containing protein [Myxococcales bacterium]|nr:choice-of-anchor D domain-containing protein [Myxococcales bacterium]
MRSHSLVVSLALFGGVTLGGLGSAWAGTLTAAPATRAFGNVSVSGGAATNTVVITNAGSDTEITSIDVPATLACAEFTAVPAQALPRTLGNGQSLTVNVSFDPTDRGAESCDVAVASDGTGGGFTLTGTGVAPVLNTLTAELNFDPQRWNGGTPQILNIQIRNDGDESIAAANLSAVLTTGGQFTIGAAVGLPISNGQTATIPITFDPTSVGPKTDTVTLSLNNDAPSEPNDTVALSGTGTQSTQTFNPTSLSIGTFEAQVGNGTAVIDLGNSGDASLTISQVSITGTHASNFTFQDHGCTAQGPCVPAPGTIAVAGAPESFSIRCAPTARGARSATLNVTSNDPGSPRTAALSCTGVSPEIDVSPTTLAFGNVRVGDMPQQQFTITNQNIANSSNLTYSVAESITDVSITCAPHATCMGTLTPGQTATVTVTFAPGATGARSGNIVVTSNDLDEGTVNVAMTGNGVESNLVVSSPFSFGNVPVAQVGGSVQNLPIANNGGATLNITSMTITGDPSFSFAFGSGLCQSGTTCTRLITLAAINGSGNIPLRCDPASAGSKVATLTIVSDDPAPVGGSSVTLNCTGTISAMTVSPTSLAFGNQRINTNSAAQPITVGNVAGLAPLNYRVTRPAAHYTVTVGAVTCNPTCTGSVAAGGSATVNVVFRPTATGVQTGTVLIEDTDDYVSDVSVTVSGTGVEPVASLTTPSTLAFGNVPNGTTSSPMTITVRNTGTMDLTISSVTNSNTTDFDLSGPTGVTTVAPSADQSWTVACDPETRGAKTGNITINNNSNNAPAIAVALTCTSIEGLLVVTASPVPVSGTTIDFGPVRLMSMVMTTVTVTNQGNVPVTISNVALASTTQGFSFSGFTPNTVVAANNGTTTFTVVFAPTLDAHGTTTMNITSDWNDPAITLTGDGQPTGFAVTPSPVNLGNVPWDGTATQVMTMRNTETATVNVLSAALVTGSGEFTITGFTAGNLAAGAMRTFNLNAVPSDAMLGLRQGVLRVTTDLPVGMGQTVDVPLSYTSVGPAVSLTPGMVVDFGGVDVDGPPATLQLTVTNTGSGRMDISSVTALSGAFARTNFADLTLDPQQAESITITYTPTGEREPTNPESATFNIVTTGLYDSNGQQQPGTIQVTVRGYGIDRHLLAPAVTFPPTYRNPTQAQLPTTTCGVGGDQPCAVRICNTGGATLAVSMIDDPDDAFDLMSTGPLTVSGGSTASPSCQEVPVEFRPPSYGTFNGTVTINNNDNAAPMAVVTLTGEGIARPVGVMPGSVPAATIAQGAPVRLSDLVAGGLVLTNMSGAESFDAEVSPVPGAAGVTARLVGDDGTLAASQTRSLDVELIGTAPGQVDVLVNVYLDGDPLEHATVTIPVEVVRVEVEGGGCDGGGGGAGGGAAAALGLLALAGWRRRRGAGARAALAALAAAVVVTAGASSAAADVSRNIDLGAAPASAATEPGLFDVDTPDVAARGSWAFGLAAQYEQNPMVARWRDSASAEHELALIASRTALLLGFGYAVTDRLELSARLPMYQQSGEARMATDPFGVEGAEGFSLGDVAVRAKMQMVAGKVAFAGALDVTAPTARDGQFTGTDLPTAHLQGLLGVKSGRRLSLALNAGFLARQSTQFLLVEQGSELTYGAAVALRVLDKVAVVGEGSGALGVVGAEGKVSPIELTLGLRVRASRAATIGIGGGSGFGKAVGVADVRGFVSLAIAPGGSKIEPVRIIVPPPPRDTGDNDGDGVVNADDACPDEAEDLDGFQDGDGCPDLDNDGDGFADDTDKCPNEAEDMDGFQDDDGCPDPDNDGDGILDVDDKCPNEAEDKDGFQDNDGCDDPDNDGDGIPDVLDQCALEPETINGVDDEDGCPDKGDAAVMLMQDRIEVLEPVQFVGVTARLRPTASKVLAQVGATLRAERGIKRIRVTVHSHPRGPGDEALTQKRADEIRRWLVQWGVEPERIDAKGIGSKRPLVAKGKRGAEEINDRVEFIILER